MNPTALVLAVAAVVLIAWDVFAVLRWGGDKTISWTLWLWGRQYPIVPFLLGVVIGHALWVQNCYC